jgi:hypothetical protein
MDLKLRRLQNARGFNNRQNGEDPGSFRTRPVPRTVPVQCNALPAPPATSPDTQNGLAPLRRTDGISPPTFRQAVPTLGAGSSEYVCDSMEQPPDYSALRGRPQVISHSTRAWLASAGLAQARSATTLTLRGKNRMLGHFATELQLRSASRRARCANESLFRQTWRNANRRSVECVEKTAACVGNGRALPPPTVTVGGQDAGKQIQILPISWSRI